jgi:hypothetical protein
VRAEARPESRKTENKRYINPILKAHRWALEIFAQAVRAHVPDI